MHKQKTLKRERINSILSPIYSFPLTIIEAPMGYGKTTAVKKFLDLEKNISYWIAFLNTGGGVPFFWDKFAAAVEKLNEKAGIMLRSLGFPIDVPQTGRVLSILNRLEYDRNTVLVLDDYHLAGSLALSSLILQIAAENIENLHIVIITRDTTDIAFTELLSKGMCQIISRQQLKFTPDETRQYCLTMMENISESDLQKISTYADGWISLIYIILLAMQKGIPVGMNNTIEELIEQGMFNQYDQGIQKILLKLSIMNNFTAPQASFVLEDQTAEVLLKKLHRENAFVFYDETDKTYKIHNVLLDYLRLKQNFNNEERQHLYRRLGEWHLEQNEFVTAYAYLCQAGDAERILTHLNDPAHVTLSLTGFAGAVEMFAGLPRELLYQYPLAYLQHIMLSIITDTEDCMEEWAQRLDELKIFYENLENIDEDYRSRIVAETLIIRKFTVFNDLAKSVSFNDEIIRLLNGQQSYLLLQQSDYTFGSPHYVYIYFRDEGGLKDLVRLITQKVGLHKYSNSLGIGHDYLAWAEYALETADLEAAELNSLKAIYKAGTKDQTSIIICAKFNLMRLYLYQGKISEAVEMLQQLELDAYIIGNPIYNTTIDMCKGYIYACLGSPEKIPYWLQTGNMSNANLLYQGIAFNYIVYGKALLASKKYVELEVMVESFCEHFSIFNNRFGFIHNDIFSAVAKYNLYGMEKGVSVFQEALAKARADNIIMLVAEYAPHILPMLQEISSRDPHDQYLKQVLVCCQQYEQSLNSLQINRVKLSPREIEVLALLAQGLNRDEIAASLMISMGTVKTHLQNIYQKLEASGKVAAIRIAQMNGYI